MNINIKFTGTESDNTLRQYVEDKIGSYGKMLSSEKLDIAVCDVELRKDTHHQSGDVCTAEVTLKVGGKVYRATKTEPNFEKAIDKVKDDMLESLRTEKGKHHDNYIKGATQAKEMLRESEQG